MRIVRFLKDNKAHYGKEEEGKIQVLEGEFGAWQNTCEILDMADVHLLPPCEPAKIICLGLNYMDHAKEFEFSRPEAPILFMKPSTCLIGHGDKIIYPKEMSHRVDYEGELAVVIGRQGKNIEPEEVSEYILGYTCANDVTARDLQPKTGQWTVAKSFDTFLPLGPAIVDKLDLQNGRIITRLNGEVKQESTFDKLIFDIPFIVSYISKIMTLLPGDVIVTGTPSGVGPMQVGDVVEVEITGIGTLRSFCCSL